MRLEIVQNGIVYRPEEGLVVLYRPGKNGGPGTQVEVDAALADTYRLATGDVVEGVTEPIEPRQTATAASDECMEDAILTDEQHDEPTALRNVSVPTWLAAQVVPTERLVSIERINGLPLAEAEDRPFPRRRYPSERTVPDRRLLLATGPSDTTGRMLDFAAPLGLGDAGIIYGPHASGLTRALRAVVSGVTADAPDVVVLLLLLRARGEELTDWRRRFPHAEVVVCPAPQDGATADQTLRMADLVLACAQRQTELGHPVLLAVDSLTGLWGTMLEADEADVQARADRSQARQRIREWVQSAGNFGGAGPLGSTLGGALTLVGTAWQQEVDPEAEEEGEIHPHLRLLEHIVHETSWRVPLSGILAQQRLYPAIDTARSLSHHEADLLSADIYEDLLAARRALAAYELPARYAALMAALESTPDETTLIQALLNSPQAD